MMKTSTKPKIMMLQRRAACFVLNIVIVIFKQGFHSVKNTDFQWSPAKQTNKYT